MTVHAPPAPGPAQKATVTPCADDDAMSAVIAHALWTEIHWLMPKDRTVSITVDGDHISVAFGPPRTGGRPTAH